MEDAGAIGSRQSAAAQEPFVTDHAVLRYIERSMAIDVEAVRIEIANSCRKGVEAGAPFVTHNNMRFVLCRNRIITTLHKKWVGTLIEVWTRGEGEAP